MLPPEVKAAKGRHDDAAEAELPVQTDCLLSKILQSAALANLSSVWVTLHFLDMHSSEYAQQPCMGKQSLGRSLTMLRLDMSLINTNRRGSSVTDQCRM